MRAVLGVFSELSPLRRAEAAERMPKVFHAFEKNLATHPVGVAEFLAGVRQQVPKSPFVVANDGINEATGAARSSRCVKRHCNVVVCFNLNAVGVFVFLTLYILPLNYVRVNSIFRH